MESTEELKRVIATMTPEELDKCRSNLAVVAASPTIDDGYRTYAIAVIDLIDSLQSAN